MDKVFSHRELIDMAASLFEAGGLKKEDAETIARDLVSADLRGLTSHGVSRIPMYLERIRRGVVNPQPEIKSTQTAPAAILLDGDNGMGFLASHRAVEEGTALAEKTGIAVVGVHNSTHFGMSASYVQQAVKAGYVCMAFTNSSPALAPVGAKVAFLGAAPLAAGIPGGKNSPDYILDMAMTIIARGKIRVAATNNEEIPLGLALDADGKPTTDAKKAFAGVCLPFGGPKGAALAMLMDLLSGMFTGANYGGDVKSLYFDHSAPQNVGHIFFFMKPDLFIPREELAARMDEFYRRLTNLPKAEGCTRIMMPGEPEAEKTKARMENGIPLSENIVKDIRETAELYKVSLGPKFD